MTTILDVLSFIAFTSTLTMGLSTASWLTWPLIGWTVHHRLMLPKGSQVKNEWMNWFEIAKLLGAICGLGSMTWCDLLPGSTGSDSHRAGINTDVNFRPPPTAMWPSSWRSTSSKQVPIAPHCVMCLSNLLFSSERLATRVAVVRQRHRGNVPDLHAAVPGSSSRPPTPTHRVTGTVPAARPRQLVCTVHHLELRFHLRWKLFLVDTTHLDCPLAGGVAPRGDCGVGGGSLRGRLPQHDPARNRDDEILYARGHRDHAGLPPPPLTASRRRLKLFLFRVGTEYASV